MLYYRCLTELDLNQVQDNVSCEEQQNFLASTSIVPHQTNACFLRLALLIVRDSSEYHFQLVENRICLVTAGCQKSILQSNAVVRIVTVNWLAEPAYEGKQLNEMRNLQSGVNWQAPHHIATCSWLTVQYTIAV